MKISVIIITYNPAQWVDRCFQSLRNSTLTPEVIVIDNGSTDGSLDKIPVLFPDAKIVETNENIGFGRANNIGMKMAYDAGAAHAFLLNQDAWVEPDTLEKLANAATANPDFALISPMHFNGNGSALDYRFSCFIAPQSCKDLYSDIALEKVKDAVYEVNFVNAAAWLLTRECLSIVGGFNPSFFIYGEDDNYIRRMHLHGLKVGVYPKTTIFHDRILRSTSIHYTDWRKLFTRNIILKYSDPKQTGQAANAWHRPLVNFIKSVVMFRFRFARQQLIEIRMLKQMPLQEIDRNRTLSKQKAPTFL